MSDEPFHFSHAGWCPTCDKDVEFAASHPYFREHLRCPNCKSIPRERALITVLERIFPKWRDLTIHEAAPAQWMPGSYKLYKQCQNYIVTQYDKNLPSGEVFEHPTHKYRSENLERQTFDDAIFDIVITQDVFEHIPHPDLAIKEIARTLKIGGAHIFTVPLVNQTHASRRRAHIHNDGSIEHIMPPIYHGGAGVHEKGALVTVDWGWDIASYLQRQSGLSIVIFDIDDIDRGIRADLNHVIVCMKRNPSDI